MTMQAFLPATAATPNQVWLAPDNDSPDLIDMFRKPELWSSARAQTSVLKLGPQQLCCTDPHGINTITELANSNAFVLLKSWGISLALEAPAIKEWDCTGRKAAEYTLKLIAAAAAAGGTVKYISMDEPLRSGTAICRDSLEGAAAKTVAYSRELKAREPALEIGDIEAYPFEPPARLERWITTLIEDGFKPAHIHLDVNVHYLDVHSDLDVTNDLRSIRDFLASDQITFGIILWSGYDPEPTDRAFFDRTMAWVRRVHAAGVPEQVIFQSWVHRSYEGCADTNPACAFPKLRCPQSGAAGCGLKSVPLNLPEGDPHVFSLTRLMNEALHVLRQ